MDAVTRTARVFVRHSATCAHKDAGGDYRKCNCRKSVLTYDNGVQKLESAKTRNWDEAEKKAQEWLDSFDPTKMELKRLKAEKESKAVTIEEAVKKYLASKAECANSTVTRTKTLLGDGEGRKGRLFAWLATLDKRPVMVNEITPELALAFRQSWTTFNDLTKHVNWTCWKGFLKFCRTMNWISMNPAQDIKGPKVKPGARTANFSDAEYKKIRAKAFESSDQLLLPFLELMRHSGMALIDATLFLTDSLEGDELTYRRVKTGREAVVVLPQHVVDLLKTLPGGQPFLDSSVKLNSSTGDWRRKLQSLFIAAGVRTVKTEVGERPAHPHMLRDTAAIGWFTNGATLGRVAKALGDSEKTVERHYSPFLEKMRKFHTDEMRAVVSK